MAKNTQAEKAALKLRDTILASYGEDAAMMATDIPRRPAVSSGSIALDCAIGIGGLPPDRFIEVFGKEGTGKTTLALLAMRNFLDTYPDRLAAILDTEHKLNPVWMETLLGDRITRVVYFQPDYAEQAVSMYAKAVTTRQVSFVLFDSIAAAETQSGTEDPEKSSFGGNSKAMARFARLAGNMSNKYECLTFAVNQVRDDMEGYHRIITPGGNAPKFHSVLRIYLKKGKGEATEEIDGEKVRVGYPIMAKIIKNHCGGQEGRVCQWWFYTVPTEKYGFGVDQIDEITRLAMITHVIERRGGWYYHPSLPDGKILGQDGFAKFVKTNEALQAELTAAIMARVGEHASEIAPISNVDIPPEEQQVAELFRQGQEF